MHVLGFECKLFGLEIKLKRVGEGVLIIHEFSDLIIHIPRLIGNTIKQVSFSALT